MNETRHQDWFARGNKYFYEGQLDDALKNFKKSLYISEEKNHKAMIARCANRVGAVLFEMGDYSKAEHFIKQSLATHEEINEELHVILTKAHLNICYKKNDKKFDKSNLDNLFNMVNIDDLDSRDNFIIFQLTENKSCLKSSYNQLIQNANTLESKEKNEFFEIPMNKRIIEEFKKRI